MLELTMPCIVTLGITGKNIFSIYLSEKNISPIDHGEYNEIRALLVDNLVAEAHS